MSMTYFCLHTPSILNDTGKHLISEKAREQLVNSQEKVNTIAEKNGFTSTSYFITSFKKYTGMSPQKYREQNQ